MLGRNVAWAGSNLHKIWCKGSLAMQNGCLQLVGKDEKDALQECDIAGEVLLRLILIGRRHSAEEQLISSLGIHTLYSATWGLLSGSFSCKGSANVLTP